MLKQGILDAMLNLNGVCTGCTIISIIIALTLHQVYLIGQGPDSFWYAKQGCRYKPAALFFYFVF